MKIKQVMLFSYDFPHKKSQDFIFRLITEGYRINYVIAAPWKKLNIPEGKRIAPNNTSLIHPKKICSAFNIKYLVLDHNSKEAEKFINKNKVDLYIIAGARILSQEIIKLTGNRILNIHPGLLPEIRGLDTILWSIYYDYPIGITAHFVGIKIDSGLMIYREKLDLFEDDTMIDLSLRLLEKQSDILIKTLEFLKKTRFSKLENLEVKQTPYNSKMDPVKEKEVLCKFKQWLKKNIF